MKTILTTLCALLLFSGFASASPTATIVVHPNATVSGDSFVLSDIATVTSADTAFRIALMSTPMGRCPLAGLTRPFNEGNITLKLRQAGIDPSTLSISGATSLLITGGGGAGTSGGLTTASALPLASQSVTSKPGVASPTAIVVHPGDRLTLVYDDDGMTISADVTAESAGAVGDTINLRRDGAIHPLQGIVQDAETVKMVE